MREFMLVIVSDAGQIVKPEWFRYYDELPSLNPDNGYQISFMGVDLAFSKNEGRDKTAIVTAHCFHTEDAGLQIYIDKTMFNAQVSNHEMQQAIKTMHDTIVACHERASVVILVESNGGQVILAEQLDLMGLKTESIPSTTNKGDRLQFASAPIEQNRVYLPKNDNAKVLKDQVVRFGLERYDDLMDAFTMTIIKSIEPRFTGYDENDFVTVYF